MLFLLRNTTEREQRKKTKMIYKANINELNPRPLEWKCKCAIPPNPFFITRVHVLAKLNLMIIIVWELWPTCNGSGLALWHCRSCLILWLWRQCWNPKWVTWLSPCCLQREKIVNEFFKNIFIILKIKKLHPKFDDAPHIHTPHVLNPQMQKTTFA